MPKRSGVGSTRPLKTDPANVLARERQKLARDLRDFVRRECMERDEIASLLRVDLARIAGLLSAALVPTVDEAAAIRKLVDSV